MSTLTAQQIYAQRASVTPALYLYNPQDKPVSGTFEGQDYVLPAANECWIKVKKGRLIAQHDEPGVLPIRGYQVDYKYDARVDRRRVKNQEGIKTETITAEMIVEHLVGPDRMSGKLGPAGVRLLTGDPELDLIIKADARETWLRKTYEDARILVTAHEQLVAAATATGKPVPMLSPRVRAAYRTVANFEAGGADFAVKHVCPKCGDRLKEDADARAHVLAYHPAAAPDLLEKLKLSAVPETKASPYAGDEETPTPVPVKRGPGRPRKVATQ